MSTMTKQCYGGIEAGGTKFVCAVGTGPDDIRDIRRLPTRTPDETLPKVAAFFREAGKGQRLRSIGIGSFGPLDLRPDSPRYGSITNTPKRAWVDTDITGIIREETGVPVVIDTDVNAAALGERAWGAGRGLDNLVYLTVGTGIGGGGMMNGKLLHGLNHPEMGHVPVPHDLERDPFSGCCPYHSDCLEGLASGEAIRQRFGVTANELPTEHPGWDLVADYLAHGIAAYIYALSPERIIVGGGVMEHPYLLDMVKAKVRRLLNGYIDVGAVTGEIDGYIVAPGLGDRSGVLGAIALAEKAFSA